MLKGLFLFCGDFFVVCFCFVLFSCWIHPLILSQKIKSMKYELKYFSEANGVIYFLKLCIAFSFSTSNSKTL